jgi:hypothetical protein
MLFDKARLLLTGASLLLDHCEAGARMHAHGVSVLGDVDERFDVAGVPGIQGMLQ